MSNSTEDRFKDIVLHHDRIDWDDPQVDADFVTSEFLGTHSYWYHEDFEDYHEKDKEGAVCLDEDGDPVITTQNALQIERLILLEGGRDFWFEDSLYGKPFYQHFLSLMKLMFPDTDITPAIADTVMFFCMSFGFRKILNLIGCQNAGKTAGGVRIMFVCLFIDPEYSAGYVASPFDNAADATIWGEVEEMWGELCQEFPLSDVDAKDEDKCSLFPKAIVYKNNPRKIVLVPKIPKGGRIELKHIKHAGKSKGSKSRGKQTHRGVMLTLVDEINEIDNMSFLRSLDNLSSQASFFAITSQNFKDEQDMGGLITEPSGIYDQVNNFDDLDIDSDFHWYSAKASVALRFDGHKAPNVLSGRIIYPYLINKGDLERLKEMGGGDQSLSYYSQGRSFPIRSSEKNSVLPKTRLSSSRHKDVFFQMVRIDGSVSFCDPSFGGRDSSVWGGARFGVAIVKDAEGVPFRQELLVFEKHMKTLKLVKDAIVNEYWLNRMQEVGLKTSNFDQGASLSFEQQVAIQCRELNKEMDIPAENFGYDFSMRPDIVSAITQIVGKDAVAFNYNREPEGYKLHHFKRPTDEVCYNRCSELAFLASDLFLTKQVRGGELVETATLQLSRTNYEEKGKKYLVEDKAAYKSRWAQKSPDARDVLMGIVGMAHLRGFRKDELKGGTGEMEDDLFDQLREMGFGQPRERVHLPHAF